MGVEVVYEENVLCSIIIDGERFDTEEDNLIVIPIRALLEQKIDDFPQEVTIELCDDINENVIMTHNVPTRCTLISKNKFNVSFEETMTRKYWDAPVGLKLWMETRRDIILDRNKNLGDINLEHFDDDGTYISLVYSCEFEVGTFKELLQAVDQIYAEIDGATDIALGSPLEKIENCNKESDFTMKILLPLSVV